jgi:Helix-turn-helix domain
MPPARRHQFPRRDPEPRQGRPSASAQPPILSAQWNGRDAFTIQEAGKILGLSRASAYAAATRGDLPVIWIGRRAIVPRLALERLLDGDRQHKIRRKP